MINYMDFIIPLHYINAYEQQGYTCINPVLVRALLYPINMLPLDHVELQWFLAQERQRSRRRTGQYCLPTRVRQQSRKRWSVDFGTISERRSATSIGRCRVEDIEWNNHNDNTILNSTPLVVPFATSQKTLALASDR